ncbi:YgjV family protein [Roseicella aerolata]|uniref:YgjV family protein n=1 Tax=Roseicella aerolata TaxID=2883479 RepID=A0A9X1IG73_9PROT|nr:YgjV family protein [Roseicella aerolata]
MTPFLAETFGYVGSLACCLWSFARTRRSMLLVQMIGSACFLLHWVLQGQGTAATMTGLLLCIAALSLFLEGPPDSARLGLIQRLYVAALIPVVLLTAATWSGAASFFAAIGTALGCYGRWQTDPGRHRAILLASSMPWLLHSILVGSVPGVCTDLFGLGRGTWLKWQQRRRDAGRLGVGTGFRGMAAPADVT